MDISIKSVLEDLGKGVTRTTTSVGYDSTIGSIEEKYNLSKADVSLMFKHPQLANKKTKKAPSFNLIDDVTEVIAVQTGGAYGARPASTTPGVTANEEPQLTAEVQAQDSEEVVVDEVATPEPQF
jgi:hypothetical protein